VKRIFLFKEEKEDILLKIFLKTRNVKLEENTFFLRVMIYFFIFIIYFMRKN